MKHLPLTAVFAFCATAMFAQSQKNDEIIIKNIIQQQQVAWNDHDWNAFSSHFTDDGTLINFIGQFWKGKADILDHFKLLNDCCLAPTSLEFTTKSIRFLTPTVAVVYLEEKLVADRDYDVPFHHYKKGDTEYKILTNIFVKTNREWEIAAAQLTLINQIVSPHELLDKP
jgi:uncharacterized protein (TIGR02246 family)